MEYNWWDDRTVEQYNSITSHPCYGCKDFDGEDCTSDGACGKPKTEIEA